MRQYLLWTSLVGFICLSGVGCCCTRHCGSCVGGLCGIGCVGCEPGCGSCGEAGDCGCGEVVGDYDGTPAPAPTCGTACGACDDCAGTCGASCRRGWPLLRALFGCAGCSGDWYWSEWYSDPPDCRDPCDRCGHWSGPVDSCAGCGSGTGIATGGTGGGCTTCGTRSSPVLAGPELAPTPVALEKNGAPWR